MSNTVSYIHCFVVYEDVTDLIKSALPQLSVSSEMELSSQLKESTFDKEHDPEQFYITEPTEISKTQEKFYFPTVLAFKTDGVYHTAFRLLLESLYEILKNGLPASPCCVMNQNDLHLYRTMRFVANVFLLLNDFNRPSTSSIITVNPFPSPQQKPIVFHEKSVINLPYVEETLLLVSFLF